MANLGLAGIALDLFSRLIEAGMREKEESEIATCKKLLRRCKSENEILRSSYDTIKEELLHSSATIIDLEHTIVRHRSTIERQKKEKLMLVTKYHAALARKIPSLEEYDAALTADAEDAFSARSM